MFGRGNVLTMIRGTEEWFEERMTLRIRLRLRRELRAIERRTEARYVALWVTIRHNSRILESSGDDSVRPRVLPELQSSITDIDLIDVNGDRLKAVTTPIRVGGSVPRLGLLVVAPSLGGPELFDLVDSTVDAVEGIMVDAFES